MACGHDDSKVEAFERMTMNSILFLFSLVGVFLIVVGGVGLADYGYLAEIVQRDAFKLAIGAGVFVLLNCLIGFMGAKWVLAEDPSNHGKGKILLLIFSLVLLFFIIFQVAVGILFLAYAGTVESVHTNNDIVDGYVKDFNDKVDTTVNCTFNYCCDQRNLLAAVKYSIVDDNGAIARNTGGIKDDPDGRSKAYSFLLGNIFVPALQNALWQATDETAANTDERTTFKMQYHAGMADYERIVDNSTDPALNKVQTMKWLNTCEKGSDDQGNRCWVKWKTMCPKPIEGITEAGWSQICGFVAVQETWQKPDPLVKKGEEKATPMLDFDMCNSLNGEGVWARDVGFKAAVIWKIQKARPLAIMVLILGFLQLLMLIVTFFLMCHRAKNHFSENKPWDSASPTGPAEVAPKVVEEGEGKSQKDEGTEDDNDL